MSEVKHIELRDEGTFISLIVTRVDHSHPIQGYVVRRAGWLSNEIIMTVLQYSLTFHSFFEAQKKNQRTFGVAYQELQKNWDSYPNGSVLDVSFILGETETCKMTEQTVTR